ncbi:MAG: ThiF family adenylyltransferase [Candidatus Omnitrophica bacterium]|nr:ThiF family adenylyltransferase [Candidatus Omnitrophota bacterium]
MNRNSQSQPQLDFDRTRYLLNPSQLEHIHVTAVGLGSGGLPVCDLLTMAGVKNWHLYDDDILEPVDLVKVRHSRRDLGKSKVQLEKEWILDHNPQAQVQAYQERVEFSSHFHASLSQTNLVLMNVDSLPAREFINDACLKAQKPFVSGLVFRTGFGGEIFSYRPGRTGCYRCMTQFANQNNLVLTDDQVELTSEEKERIYGLDDHQFRASGLAMDISMIATIHARVALSLLVEPFKTHIPPIQGNWIIFANRPFQTIFHHHFESRFIQLAPQKGCLCTYLNSDGQEAHHDDK